MRDQGLTAELALCGFIVVGLLLVALLAIKADNRCDALEKRVEALEARP